MYYLVVTDEDKERLENANTRSPSIGDRLIELQNNPLTNAIKTNMSVHGEYYVNAGKWCILFNINGNEVNIVNLMRSEKLHKIFNGKIKQ